MDQIPGAPERSANGREEPADDRAQERLLRASVEAWLTDLAAILGEVRRLVSVRLERTRLHVRQRGFQLAFGLLVLIGAGTATLLGVRLFVRGLAGGFAALLPARPWAAELLAGAVVLAALALGAALVLAASNRSELRRLRAKYDQPTEENPDEPARKPEEAPERAAHSAGVPGAPRG